MRLSGTQSAALTADRALRFDVVHASKQKGDGDLALLIEAGLYSAPNGTLNLTGWRQIGSSTVVFQLAQQGDAVIALSANGCSIVSGQKLVPCAPANGERPEGLAATRHANSRSLIAERSKGLWRFRLRSTAKARDRFTTLTQGRFDHDRFLQASFCQGRLHLVDQGAFHTSGETQDWRATTDARATPQPDVLLCADQDRIAALPSGPWLARLDGTWTAWNGTTFEAGKGNQPAWAAAGLGTAPKFHGRVKRQSRRFALLFSAENDVTQYLKFEDDTTPDQFTAKDYLRHTPGQTISVAIDLPERFFSLGNQIWAVTKDGLVPHGTKNGVALQVSPTLGRRVPFDFACTVASTRRINDGLTHLNCVDGQRFDVNMQPDGTPVVQLGQQLAAPYRAIRCRDARIRIRSAGNAAVWRASKRIPIDRAFCPRPYSDDACQRGNATSGIRGRLASFAGQSVALESGGDVAREVVALRRRHRGLSKPGRLEQRPQADRLCFVTPAGARLMLRTSARQMSARPEDTDPCLTFLGQDGLRAHWWDTNRTWVTQLPVSGLISHVDELQAGRFASDIAHDLPKLAPKLTNPDFAFCAQSAVKNVVILGTEFGATTRADKRACSPRWNLAPVRADNTVFSISYGRLMRAR